MKLTDIAKTLGTNQKVAEEAREYGLLRLANNPGKGLELLGERNFNKLKSILKLVEVALEDSIKDEKQPITSPAEASKQIKDLLKLKIRHLEKECFGLVYLDNQHRVIEVENLFYGTIDSCSVYPREIIKSLLQHNAAAVILYHNHPSGISTPSQADRAITERIKKSLMLLDVRVLDHIIVGNETYSFAQNGDL